MFLHLSVILLFTGGGVVYLSACWDTPILGSTPREAHTPPWEAPALEGGTRQKEAPPPREGSTPKRKHPLRKGRTFPPPTPRKTAAAADGKHPTGMHSCFLLKIIRHSYFFKKFTYENRTKLNFPLHQ